MPDGTNICLATELTKAPLNQQLTLVDSRVDQGSRIRLASLGLRLGSTFSLIARTAGGGRVAVVSGTRVALGKSLLTQLSAEVVR
ncbi:FeoA-like protein [Propionicimonas paludicola]|uniref:FeoA-like protein n=1 Tax=Propionicimonas paludicola TaxID=185243 RepID=A0A2A9CPD6_9ACTN|nr:ferrous iron transport protein A [Propionicimonas paludicola]PFG15945.1 FeoA-like protein [Propionicimonas paludicola]